MVQGWIRQVLLRDLGALRRQIEAYDREGDLWATPPGVSNSAGNLALHVAGNLQHFVGATVGGTGYERDRPAEFEGRDVPRDELYQALDETAAAVAHTLAGLSDDRLHEPFPPVLGNVRVTTGDFLLHLATHLSYHLGQVDYHRRIVTGSGALPDVMDIGELATASEG
ncbi:MAG: hypothetical protein DHS20C21_13650 [Gemmatimonadota bacterium]|nr:MAG: hypothetical protein DHS20C21_13650 [Gemmatimonadota bacterium]